MLHAVSMFFKVVLLVSLESYLNWEDRFRITQEFWLILLVFFSQFWLKIVYILKPR